MTLGFAAAFLDGAGASSKPDDSPSDIEKLFSSSESLILVKEGGAGGGLEGSC